MKALLRQCFFISIITEDLALKRTTNYARPDWEKSDFIQMSDFNDLTHKLDTALKSHDTLNTKADTSAVTAVQQEVAAAREANCLVKLAGPLVTTANAAMEFDLSQVDMTKVAALFVVFSAGGSGEIKLSANDTVVSSICSNNFYNSAGIAWFVPINGGISCAVTGCTDNKTSLSGFCGTCKTVAWTTINKIMIKGDSTAGAAAILFGVKK